MTFGYRYRNVPGMPTIESTFKPRQHVTDAEGNRASFVRTADKSNGFNLMYNTAIVRYVGDKHDSAVPEHDLTAGWAK